MPVRSLARRALDSLAFRIAARLPDMAADPLAQRVSQRLAGDASGPAIDALLGRLDARFDAEHARRTAERGALEAERAAFDAERAAFDASRSDPRWIQLGYPVVPRPRWGADLGLPRHERLIAAVRDDDDATRESLRTIAACAPMLRRIPCTTEDPGEPHWCQDWLPGVDAASLYAFVASRTPRTFIEVGSGNSTKFVRRSIDDHGLGTRLVSIDPHPRAEIDALCTEVVRQPLEETDLSIFGALGPGDICFIDNSHLAFQNSDVTVFMLEVLPSLKPGVLVGIHDIMLPSDYPEAWRERFYNEQYLLAAYLLGGHAGTRIVLPVYDAVSRPEMASIVTGIWDGPEFAGVARHGGAFWMETV